MPGTFFPLIAFMTSMLAKDSHFHRSSYLMQNSVFSFLLISTHLFLIKTLKGKLLSLFCRPGCAQGSPEGSEAGFYSARFRWVPAIYITNM